MTAATAVSTPPRLTVAVVVLATVGTVFPAFLTGALAVQIRDEFSVAEGTYGWAMGGFFLAATFGSIVLGRVAQLVGPRKQIIGVLSVSALSQIYIAAFAASFASMVVALVVCGVANAGNQTAINLALARARLGRLGLGIAFKQSGMPAAALLGGLAVPAIALTVGWRWAFAAGSLLACVSVVGVLAVVAPFSGEERRRPVTTPASTRRALLLAAVAGGLLAFSAGALNAWVVSSGVEAGLSPGVAGVMLSAAAATGITIRLLAGLRLDSMRRRPFHVAGVTVMIGAVGMATLAVRSPVPHAAATVVAFAGGWIWPVFTNFGVVRSNEGAAAAATGVTQMGVYVGVFSGPLVTGLLIEAVGYQTMWVVVALVTTLGGMLSIRVAPEF